MQLSQTDITPLHQFFIELGTELIKKELPKKNDYETDRKSVV